MRLLIAFGLLSALLFLGNALVWLGVTFGVVYPILTVIGSAATIYGAALILDERRK